MQIRLFKNWWLMTLKGLLAISFGAIVLIKKYPLIKSSLAISFGILLLVSGVMIITGAFLHKKTNPRWIWWLIEGVLDIIIGAFFVFNPDLAKAFFLFFLALWACIIGAIQILTSFRMIVYMERWWFMLLSGIFSILFAVLIFINPFYPKFNLFSIIGIACIIFGMLTVFLSRTLRDIYM
jgi:uncharacterized membrane protein HdeD (DUF308 family)